MMLGPPAAATDLVEATRIGGLTAFDLGPAPAHGSRGNPGRLGDDDHTARPQLRGLHTQPQPSLQLVQMRPKDLIAASQRPHRPGHTTNRIAPRAETRLFHRAPLASGFRR
jgi:hypothetical protein